MADNNQNNTIYLLFAVVVGLWIFSNSDDKKTMTNTDTADILVEENSILIDLPELGQLRGIEDNTTWTNQKFYKFLGVPFAETPLNELRFKPPVPQSKWQGIKEATKFGKRCPALIDYIPLEDQKFDTTSEDCLNLCVYTKDFNEKRPVMVYIHGGALWNGTALEHPGNFLLEKDIVYVAIQYRLGALGFISTQTSDIPGNMGILDVKLALEWIQKNIKYFGGNPDDVTVFGESAGGAITSLLMISPKIPQTLFRKAIAQSGSALMPGIYDNNPLENARTTCEKLECKNCENVNEINQCLKKASVFDLLKIAHESPNPIQYGLTIEDVEGVLPKQPKQLLMETTKEYQVMAGVLQNDGSFIISLFLQDIFNPENTPREIISKVINFFGNPDETGIIENIITKLYFQPGQIETSNLKEVMPQIIDIISTMLFKSPLHKFVELYSKQHSSQKNYLYNIDYVGQHVFIPFVPLLQNMFPYYPFVGGVHHADDLLYLFPTKDLNENDTEMAKTMIDLWTSFAINGKPEVKNGPEILPIKNGKGPYFQIDKKITIADDFTDEFMIATKKTKV